jgi:hypothetical protein
MVTRRGHPHEVLKFASTQRSEESVERVSGIEDSSHTSATAIHRHTVQRGPQPEMEHCRRATQSDHWIPYGRGGEADSILILEFKCTASLLATTVRKNIHPPLRLSTNFAEKIYRQSWKCF